MINPLAQELNDALKGTTPGELLSDVGTRLYFPKGIIAQSAEAKKLGKTANGTIGTTVVEGKPIMLPSIKKYVPDLTSSELVGYAPTAGNPDLRAMWKESIIRKNPLLKDKKFSLPVVVPGLTAGISYLADLFLDETKPLVAADPSWDNYVLIAEARRNAKFVQFKMFKDGKFNIEGLKETMQKQAESGSVRILLNFPQNPSGYSPTSGEAKQLVSIVKEIAEKGAKVMVWCDDAYFGLNYEDNIEKQSLFAYLCDLHENVLAAKIDGPTKEDFAWGFRTGFITFGCKGLSDAQYEALVKKLMAAIRSSVSCAATPSQSLILKAASDGKLEEEKAEFRKILERRYKLVRDFVSTHESKFIKPLPFNSGYFMSFDTMSIDAEKLRQKLLNDRGIGTISIDVKTLRVAFSSLDEEKINIVYQAIYDIADELGK
ncbi:aminotransferase class I/II-fold pyridoxal phosphate-dependent enzyme [Treponema succinifaciens]|uniref:Aminotransferase class I and II n=1 Tax=Treponema succinifaciens (strain ATCC 33096 / DSM 2489 / 6091) TaxID=869209 RepID=F2NWL1_TRES6|nr:aminotransferase class I/II-fold pyridoxal phosphate-dependent enzyme [Treponema succinifaciens]AEB15200.1 aminotransferase class I and II [Treponema succinifaciens DSM 2489]MCI6911683.1 aminotransferase class I/II-fold pyridoxal phosphate-dependent enzyme [Treponema succinifaciens]UKI55961.1 MAG: aminotransferase class I/II-fold pyridoxal phosphate-dependent enzyme [Treponema succinifaciens]